MRGRCPAGGGGRVGACRGGLGNFRVGVGSCRYVRFLYAGDSSGSGYRDLDIAIRQLAQLAQVVGLSVAYDGNGTASVTALMDPDTVLGRGTTVVAHPDGKLGAYLDSLHRLRDLAEAQGLTTVWPGHGPVIDDALAALDFYLAHRRDRLERRHTSAARGQDRGHPAARLHGRPTA